MILKTGKNGQMTFASVVVPFPIPAHKDAIMAKADAIHARLLPLLRRIKINDALVASMNWGLVEMRIELVHLSTGVPHYRLYHGDTLLKYPDPRLVGIVDVATPEQRNTAIKTLATYLWCCGWRPDNVKFVSGGAITSEFAWKWHQDVLFYASCGRKEARLKTG